MLVTVEGKFENGKIILTEDPAGVKEAKVIVTFLPAGPNGNKPSPVHFGMFKGSRTTEPEDFRLAEWPGAANVLTQNPVTHLASLRRDKRSLTQRRKDAKEIQL